jgi:PhnB protein
MAKASKPIPEGFHSVTPHIAVRGAAAAIDFYKRAFGAQEIFRMAGPGGVIGHAELKIGDSVIMLADEFPGSPVKAPQTLGGTTGVLNIYVPDVDRSYQQAVGAGAKETMPVADMFWGDRYGQVTDPFGHVWALGTHQEDLSETEIEERAKQFWAHMQSQKKTA